VTVNMCDQVSCCYGNMLGAAMDVG